MKLTRLLFSLLLLITTVSVNASTAWVPNTTSYKIERKWQEVIRTQEGLPVYDYVTVQIPVITYGFQVVYNVETDGGVSNHIVNQTVWNAIRAQTVSRVVYFPGNWQFSAVNLDVPANIEIIGDGKDFSNFTLTGVSSSITTPWFISYGKSHLKFRDFRILSRNVQMLAIFQFNSMNTASNDSSYDVNLENLHIDTSWTRAAIRGGDKANGETHHIVDLNVRNCEIGFNGNPSQRYNTAKDNQLVDTDKCYGINFGITTWGGEISGNHIHDCSGEGIKGNLSGWNNARGLVQDQRIGNFNIHDNTIENCFWLLVFIGNYTHGLKIINNYLYNPTGSDAIAISVAGDGIITDNNTIATYEGRIPEEVYGSNCIFGHDKITIFLHKHPIAATNRTQTSDATFMAYTGGFNLTYYQDIRYDSSFGISNMCPARRAGMLFSNYTQETTQPQVWDGRNYANGYHVHSHLYNFTGAAITAETVRQDFVNLYEDCILQSALAQEDFVRIGGKGWRVFCQIDGSGSASTTIGAVSVNTNQAGTAYNYSVVKPLVTNWNNATKLKNNNLYSSGSFISLPKSAVLNPSN